MPYIGSVATLGDLASELIQNHEHELMVRIQFCPHLGIFFNLKKVKLNFLHYLLYFSIKFH